ncbi:electron transfer flavoprotein subunit beta/FixA family protein [bacterium]|nr:electron transfer flavoprotein subunit beta/FixA family protein [bacterium]
MKVAALIKQVPDTETKIRVKADGSGIEEADIKYIISPYCEFGVEEAIKQKEKAQAETTVISLGGDKTVEALRTALAMGIDKAVHIDSQGRSFDSYTTALVLSKVIKERGFDVVFCGKQAIDGDMGQVAQMLAELLDAPQVMIAEKFELAADKTSATITRRISGGAKEVYDVKFPAVVGCEKGINVPRYASLPGIMKAKSKPVEKLNAAELLGDVAPLVTYKNYQLPAERAAGKKLEGEPAQQAAQLVKLLREEAKVI